MTIITLAKNGRQLQVEQVSPAAQASTNTATVVTGSEIDVRFWSSLSYTLKNITQTITYWIYGANASDYSDEVSIQTADILANGIANYSIERAPYAYYRVKIKSKVDDVHGTTTVRGIAKD